MSPGDIVRAGKRHFLEEEHIAYSCVLVIVVIAATIYAIDTKDHSANVWAVYVGTVTGIFGLLTGRRGARREDRNG